MSGNVLEWVWNTKGRVYKENAVDPVYVSPQTTERGVRGGWIIDREVMNVSTRYFQSANKTSRFKGFRLVRTIPKP